MSNPNLTLDAAEDWWAEVSRQVDDEQGLGCGLCAATLLARDDAWSRLCAEYREAAAALIGEDAPQAMEMREISALLDRS